MSMQRIHGSHATLWDQMQPGDHIRLTYAFWSTTITIEGILTTVHPAPGGKYVAIGHRLYGSRMTIPRKPSERDYTIRTLARDPTISDTLRTQIVESIGTGYPPPTIPKQPTSPHANYSDIPLF